ncbi:MAG: ribose 5-phosphate isomerase B [Bacteroidales bacterium]
MKKREFLKKAGIISASVLTVPAFGIKQSGVDHVKIVIGSDHAGFPLKSPIINMLKSWGHIIKDVGSFTPDPVDFPDIALLLADEIKSGRAEKGIMVCGTGVGASIACNKIQGIRAALCHDTYSAHQCVEHDNVNVICIGAQIIGLSLAEEILSNFLNAKFSTEEQFRRRVQKLDSFDLVLPKK